MKELFLLFSHTLTPKQIADASTTLHVDEFVSLTNSLQELWSSVPPTLDRIDAIAVLFEEFLLQNATAGDFVLVHKKNVSQIFYVFVIFKRAFLQKRACKSLTQKDMISGVSSIRP